jgi:hypothetical protein
MYPRNISPASPPPNRDCTLVAACSITYGASCCKKLQRDIQGCLAPLVMAAPRRDIPHGFYHTTAYGDELVPTVHQDVLLTAVE